MSARTKTHPTEEKNFARHEEKSIPWRDVFKNEIERFTESGMALRGARHKAGLTQKQLAEEIGVKTHHISEMEHGKRPIGKKMAQRLSNIFKVDYRTFL